MKVKLDNGDMIDTGDKPYILLIHEGDIADIVISGTEYEAAQLIDAVTRNVLGPVRSVD